MDDFKDAPKSISQLRYEKACKSEKVAWGILKPRDLLIELLRDIDNGAIEPTSLAIVIGSVKDGEPANSLRSCGASFSEVAGEMTLALHRLCS